jgi:tubulin-specific chaperone A
MAQVDQSPDFLLGKSSRRIPLMLVRPSHLYCTRRLAKEVAYYEKEVKENEKKLEGMKEDKKDAYDIKKFEEVLGESYMMIPDSKARFQTSLEELSLFIDGNPDLQGEWISAAKYMMEEHGISTNTPASETNVDDLKEGEAF